MFFLTSIASYWKVYSKKSFGIRFSSVSLTTKEVNFTVPCLVKLPLPAQRRYYRGNSTRGLQLRVSPTEVEVILQSTYATSVFIDENLTSNAIPLANVCVNWPLNAWPISITRRTINRKCYIKILMSEGENTFITCWWRCKDLTSNGMYSIFITHIYPHMVKWLMSVLTWILSLWLMIAFNLKASLELSN